MSNAAPAIAQTGTETPPTSIGVTGATLMTTDASAASTTLLAGPAAAMYRKSRRGCLRLFGSTGTGLAHPMIGAPAVMATIGSSSVPIGSMCRTGFSEIRPRRSAVRSPKRAADQACADS